MPDVQPAIQIGRMELRGSIARQIVEDVHQSETDRRPYIAQLDADRELYNPHATRTNPPWKGACSLQAMMCLWVRDQLMARIYRALLAQTPVLHVHGGNSDDREEAARVQGLLNVQCDSQLFLPSFLRPVLQASLEDGAAVVYVGWRTDKRVRTRWQMAPKEIPQEPMPVVDPATGATVMMQPEPLVVHTMQAVKEDVTEYDGPDLRHLDIRDWGTYPAGMADVDKSTGVWMRYHLTGDQVLQRLREGAFDKAAVQALKGWNGEPATTTDEKARSVTPTDSPARSFRARTFRFLEVYWRMVPEDDEAQEQSDEVAQDWRLILHEDTYEVMLATPSPWWDGMRPFAVFRCFPDKFGVLGDSLTDKVGDTQRAMTTLLRLFLDGTAVRVAPRRAVQRGLLSASERAAIEQAPPNAFLELDYPESLKVMETGDAVTPSLPVFDAVRMLGERSIGVSDANMAVMSGRTRTATEVTETLGESDALFALIVDTLAEGISRVGRLLLARDYQYVGNDSVQHLWGIANPPKPITLPDGTEMPAEAAAAMQGGMQEDTPGLDELGRSYRVSAAGSAETANLGLRSQRAQQAFAILRQEPLVNRDPKLVWNIVEYFIREVLHEDPERFIGTLADWQQDYMQQMQAAAAQADAQAEAESQAIAEEDGRKDRQVIAGEVGRAADAVTPGQAEGHLLAAAIGGGR